MNRRQHTVDIRKHVVVPKAEDSISLRMQAICTVPIFFICRTMLGAIDLNRELQIVAREINKGISCGNGCRAWVGGGADATKAYVQFPLVYYACFARKHVAPEPSCNPRVPRCARHLASLHSFQQHRPTP
jgi:hypothetical protein